MAKKSPLPKKLFDAHNHLWGEDVSNFLEDTHGLDVETTVLMGLPFGPASELKADNDACIRAQQDYPGRFIAGVYVDPRQGKRAIDAVARAHGQGVRLVKLFPNLGYYPDDPKLRPFFDAVAKRKMAVLSHCGWLWPKEVAPHAAHYASPGRFEKVIRMHPETIFVFAHMGGIPGFLEIVMLTTFTPNVYVDCSPGQGWWVLESAPQIAGTIPPEKLLWGSDMKKFSAKDVERCRKALVGAGFGPHFDKIFYSNARGIFEKLGLLKPKKAGRRVRGERGKDS